MDPFTLLWSALIIALHREQSSGSFSAYILCFFLEFAAISCFDLDKIRTADIYKCHQLFLEPINHRLCIIGHDKVAVRLESFITIRPISVLTGVLYQLPKSWLSIIFNAKNFTGYSAWDWRSRFRRLIQNFEGFQSPRNNSRVARRISMVWTHNHFVTNNSVANIQILSSVIYTV